MQDKPRASIHVGEPQKSFSAAEASEPERRGWNEDMYKRKNLDSNNHYDFSRKKFNFEINTKGEIIPLGSNPIPLNERVKNRLDELGFSPYYEKDHPDVIADNSPNCTLTMIIGGDHDVLHQLAYGDQNVDLTLQKSNADITIHQGIYNWAKDTHQFLCDKYGAENVIGFDVHLDETSPHIQAQIIPVAKTKTRGRKGFQYQKKDDKSIVLSTKEWKKLSKEQQKEYIKVEKSKEEKECVSYAEVFGKNKYEVRATYFNLHTEYHDKVGYKYGLERGFTKDELTEEEQRERVHKSKDILEAERLAKENITKKQTEIAILDGRRFVMEQQTEEAEKRKENAEKEANLAELFKDLAGVAEIELTIPSFKINEIIKTAKQSISTELNTPIPMMNQREWRVERLKNIKNALTDMQTDLGNAKDSHNSEISELARNIYKYYKQQLNKLIKENEDLRIKNKTLEEKNSSLEKDNRNLKDRISKIDANAVENLRIEKDRKINALQTRLTSETNRADNAEVSLNDLRIRWKNLWSYPEMSACWNGILKREQEEKAKREAEEQEKQEQQKRYNGIVDRFIKEGREVLHAFALASRTQFSDSEANSIYYGIIATSVKKGISLLSTDGIEQVTKDFLSGMSWSGCTEFTEKCVKSWTTMFATQEVTFEDSTVGTFLAFVDHMACSQDTYVSLMGSNGCANQLTNWDGTKKRGLEGAPTKKNGGGRSK